METETETETTKIWNSLFSELLEAENGLSEAVQILNDSVNSNSLKIPTEGYKTEDWRNLHNKISKNSKTIEKVKLFINNHHYRHYNYILLILVIFWLYC